jgi:hypothetical protein
VWNDKGDALGFLITPRWGFQFDTICHHYKAAILRPEGANGESLLGQRPRSDNNEMTPALKGRNPPRSSFHFESTWSFSTSDKTTSRVE